MKTKLFVFAAIVLLIGISFSGCKKENIKESDRVGTIELKFESISGEKGSFDTYEINYNFNDPMSSESEDLEVVEAWSQDGTEIIKSYMIIKKEDEESKNNKSFRIYPGYFWDGEDCFIYGTWYEGDNGVAVFNPADITTQYLLNRCGYSNLA